MSKSNEKRVNELERRLGAASGANKVTTIIAEPRSNQGYIRGEDGEKVEVEDVAGYIEANRRPYKGRIQFIVTNVEV